MYINGATFLTGILLGIVMIATFAFKVVVFIILMLMFNAAIMLLLRNKKHFLASNLLIFLLYFVTFAAIKFDAYIDVYETYVLATLGLVLLIITSLISFYRWQIVSATILIILGILSLWWTDILPEYGYTIDTLQIQNLATSLLMVILGSLSGITLVSIQENLLFSTNADKDRIKRMLSMTEIYTKKSLVSIIAEGKDPTKFIPVEQNRVILFCDIRNFTGMAETMSSIDIVRFLNSFFSKMNAEIQAHGGEIDKLIGDCIMANFDTITQGHLCSISMRKHLQRYNIERIGYNLKPISVGIGLSYGPVVIGNIGSESKMDFTSIGDVVNSSSRIESLTKIYGVDILTSITPDLNNPLYTHCRYIDSIRVKGKLEPISIYEIFDHEPERVREFKMANMNRYEKAHKLYCDGNFSDAAKMYDTLIQKAGRHTYKPNLSLDPALDYFKNRCTTLANPVIGKSFHSADWDGVFAF